MASTETHLRLLANKLETSCLQLSLSQPLGGALVALQMVEVDAPLEVVVTAHCAQCSAPALLPSTRVGNATERMDVRAIPLTQARCFIDGGGAPKETLDKIELLVASSLWRTGMRVSSSNAGAVAPACVASGQVGAEARQSSASVDWRDCHAWVALDQVGAEVKQSRTPVDWKNSPHGTKRQARCLGRNEVLCG